MFERLEGEATHLLNELIELSYFMRGAITYDALMGKTFTERRMIGEFLSSRLESESQKASPNY
jgi:hypothetical protein